MRTISVRASQYALRTPTGACFSRWALNPSTPTPLTASHRATARSKFSHVIAAASPSPSVHSPARPSHSLRIHSSATAVLAQPAACCFTPNACACARTCRAPRITCPAVSAVTPIISTSFAPPPPLCFPIALPTTSNIACTTPPIVDCATAVCISSTNSSLRATLPSAAAILALYFPICRSHSSTIRRRRSLRVACPASMCTRRRGSRESLLPATLPCVHRRPWYACARHLSSSHALTRQRIASSRCLRRAPCATLMASLCCPSLPRPPSPASSPPPSPSPQPASPPPSSSVVSPSCSSSCLPSPSSPPPPLPYTSPSPSSCSCSSSSSHGAHRRCPAWCVRRPSAALPCAPSARCASLSPPSPHMVLFSIASSSACAPSHSSASYPCIAAAHAASSLSSSSSCVSSPPPRVTIAPSLCTLAIALTSHSFISLGYAAAAADRYPCFARPRATRSCVLCVQRRSCSGDIVLCISFV